MVKGKLLGLPELPLLGKAWSIRIEV